MFETWRFEKGQWEGPLWPIKTLYWSCYALVGGILLMVIAILLTTLVRMLGVL